jgi:lipopolysaccharide/colanic/teichoic acid biosynthesis glycosyltransferase
MIECKIMQRLFDLILSISALCLLSPLFIVTIILLRFTGENEVFYKQNRVGKFKKEFGLLKFATMLKNSPTIGTGTLTVKDDPRVLPLGKLLRKTKINEIPQLINIISGEMSIIGPRPQTVRCFSAFPEGSQNIILKVKPGLSGIGSILFRDEEEMMSSTKNPDKFYDEIIMPYKGKLEEWYVRNKSIYLNLLLIFITISVVLLPKQHLIWKVFPSLPIPPKELHAYLNWKF